MPMIQWSSTLSVGLSEIDGQHKILIGLINELSDAMAQQKGKEVVGKTIKGLLDYTITHFSNEEKYFDRFKYENTADHKREHALFISRVREFQSDYEKGTLGVAVDVMFFLSDWLKKHIQGSDKKYVPLFSSKGVK
jgi:hemerythrin